MSYKNNHSMKIEIKELSPESDLVGYISLTNGIEIWWGLESVESPKTKSEALELASFICSALNNRSVGACTAACTKSLPKPSGDES